MKDVLFLSRSPQASWTPPIHKILAYFHGGRIFTETLPVLARIGLAVNGILLGLWWVAYWGVIFRDYERWSLVCAALVHFAFLALAYLFGRIAWLRLDHLRRIPPGETAALRSFPILLRLGAELFFVGVVAVTLMTVAMPAPSPPPVLGDGGPLRAMDSALPNPFASLAVGIGTTLSLGMWSLLALVLFYGLANAVETYLAIELNTRNHPSRRTHHDELVRETGE